MHRNTVLTIAILGIIAALVVGIRIGQIISPSTINNQQLAIASPSANNINPAPSASNTTSEQKKYTHTNCGVTFDLDSNFEVLQASDAAQMTNSQTNEHFNLICGIDFPVPPLAPERIEEATVAGEPATIYHDASAKDGTPVDVVVFINPKNDLEIALFGFGEVFQKLLKSLRII